MRGRIPWTLLLGLGAGLVLARRVLRSPRRRLGVLPGGKVQVQSDRLPREPEVIRGSTPVELGLERPVATGLPLLVSERSERRVPLPPRPPPSAPTRFEPVVPDAPEERDPRAEPVPMQFPHAPVPPIVRKRH
jgi:hypothetical protein